jgi:hypothetical protein
MAEDLAYWRGEACAVIRAELWRGNAPPDPRWNMGRECTIFNGFCRQFTPEEVHGAYTVMRRCLGREVPPGPVDGRIFNVAGKRERLSRCVAFWRREQQARAANDGAVAELVRRVSLGGMRG